MIVKKEKSYFTISSDFSGYCMPWVIGQNCHMQHNLVSKKTEDGLFFHLNAEF